MWEETDIVCKMRKSTNVSNIKCITVSSHYKNDIILSNRFPFTEFRMLHIFTYLYMYMFVKPLSICKEFLQCYPIQELKLKTISACLFDPALEGTSL